jgi:cysteine desulfurase/selenocysteine lyase
MQPVEKPLDLTNYKQDFPLLAENPSLYYLDSAATTQKTQTVIEATQDFYSKNYGTVRRGVYKLSAKATQAYEETRQKAATLLGAKSSEEIIYTSGTTQSINLVAYSYGCSFLSAGDEIIISTIEHHANITPWQMVCERTGATLKVIPVLDDGTLDTEAYKELLSSNTKIVAVNHISNALGTVNPVKEMAQLAHEVGAVILVDGAQSVAHMPVDVQDIDADFYVFSGHKIYGPSGIGILYGKYELLEKMPPYQRGGDMIEEVTFEKTTYQKPPYRFEAGTPAIAEVVGLGVAIDYMLKVGMKNIAAHEDALLQYGTRLMEQLPGVQLIGTAPDKAGILSFYMNSAHPHDIGTILDDMGIAIRAGHHCAQPTMERFNVPATARASLGIYNTYEDLDKLAEGIQKVTDLFG